MAIAGLLAIVAAQCDRLVIAALLGDDAIGRYAAGYDLAHQTLTTAFMIVNLAATPLAIHAFDSGGLASARKQLAANGKVLLMVTIPVAVALLQFRELLVTFLIGAQFHEAALSIFPWIVVSAFLQGLKLYYLDSVFYLLKNTRALVVSFAPAVLLNVWLNFLLVPSYGIRGSAYAALLSNAVSLALGAVLILFILRRHHRMALR